MKLTGHKTEAVYRRYAIVSEADLAAGVTRLAVLHESLTKATRTVVPMRPVRSGGDHSERGGCGPPPVAAPRSGPQATRAPPQHLRAGVLDLVREGVQPARDGGAAGLQLGANLFRAADVHASLTTTARWNASWSPPAQSMIPFDRR